MQNVIRSVKGGFGAVPRHLLGNSKRSGRANQRCAPDPHIPYRSCKFIKRFQYLEEKARENGKQLRDMTLAEMDVTGIRKVVDLWTEQYEELGALDDINHVQIFENKGAMMGASSPHPHGQVWASDFMPQSVGLEEHRQREHFDYIEEPDIFHECFGHCPMLTDKAFCVFMERFGALALELGGEWSERLFRLFWFTVEFGLIQPPGGELRAYGAGLCSSIGEARYALTHGRLADLAPTLLDLMGMEQPEEMTGTSLIQ